MSDPLNKPFALRFVKLDEYLQNERSEYSIPKKILDSGVSIGFFIGEARQGHDRADLRVNTRRQTKKLSKAITWSGCCRLRTS
jgi:hypothetical protein